jgi:caa(3)-type oxidase subunit IV
MAHSSNEPHITVLPPDKEKIRHLWRVALILLIVTVFEFVVAFSIPHQYHVLKVAIFVALTIVKAGYIVMEFMHLKHETKVLFWSIMIPMVFVVWMLVAFVYEGIKMSDINFINW